MGRSLSSPKRRVRRKDAGGNGIGDQGLGALGKRRYVENMAILAIVISWGGWERPDNSGALRTTIPAEDAPGPVFRGNAGGRRRLTSPTVQQLHIMRGDRMALRL